MKTADELILRKLRKKLRQIENLERLSRTLTPEEELKVLKKHDIRSELLELLSSCSQDGATSGPMTTALGGSSGLNVSLDSSRDDSWIHYEEGHESEEEYEEELYSGEDEEDEETCIPEAATDEEKMKRLTERLPELPDSDVSPAKKPKHEVKPESSSQKSAQSLNHKQAARDQHSNTATKQHKTESHPVNPLKQLQRQWLNASWTVTRLDGHQDLVCSVAMWGRWLLTGSRDTTVRFWDVLCETELRSMGGHTGCITSVVLLQPKYAYLLAEEMSQTERISLEPDTCLGISASLDCSIKVWNLSSGEQLRSLYAYSPVTQLVFGVCGDRLYLLSGSEGGKVELWDVASNTTSHSIIAHDDAVTGLQLQGDQVYSGSADGEIKVHHIRENRLHPIFVSENVRLPSGSPLLWRHIRCLATANQMVYYGDDAMNVKVIDWRHGVAHKLSNHTTEFGATDALCVSNDLDLLLASGYDLDNGLGFINVRHLPDEKYLCSLCDEQTSRIVTIACSPTYPHSNGVTIATGGMELCLWKHVAKQTDQSQDSVYRAQYVSQFSRPARHSDIESDTEADLTEEGDDDEEEDISQQDNQEVSPPFSRRPHSPEGSRGWFSWCSLL